MLCTNGAANGANLQAGFFAYNHSDTYATEVIALANSYGQTQAQTVAAGTAGGIAVDWALAQVGTPYIWGGESPGVAFVGSGSGEVMDAPRPKGDRRLELPFSFEVAA